MSRIAKNGAMIASTVAATAMMSSTRLATGAPTPAVETLTTGLLAALTAWTLPASTMPSTTMATVQRGVLPPKVWAVIATITSAPAAGLTTVWIMSLTWSTVGTLSARISMHSSTAMSRTAHHSPRRSYGAGRLM